MLILIPVAYLLGSVPFGLLVGLAKGIDPRKTGSGNIGATNVGRLLGGKFFALVFALDLLKALVPMLAGAFVLRGVEKTPGIFSLWLAVGFAAILGHMFSVFLKFKGGKGVATSAGMMLGLWPYYTLPALGTIGTFVVVFLVWRYVSLASIASAIAFPICYAIVAFAMKWDLRQQWPLMIFAVVVGALVIWKHRTNITRLRAGTEHRFAWT